MHPDLRKNEIKFYYCKKLKWYQWLLQKLHIKNYWEEVKGAIDITLKGE